MILAEAALGLRTELRNFAQGLDTAQNKVRSFGENMQANAAKIRQAGLAIGVVSAAIVGLGTKGVMELAKFQQGIANVSTMLDETSMKRLPEFTKGIRQMSVKFGEGTQALTKGLYDILSAGIDSSKAMDVLGSSVVLAKAGLTDTGIAADALTTVLNSYSLSTEQAGDVSDWMFAIVRKGKTTMAELAPTIGRVASMGAVAGLTLDDMGAALATMTRAGLKTDEAITSLRMVLRAFVSPTEEAKKTAKLLGIELNTNTLRTKGLIPVIKALSQATDEQKSSIFGNVRAFTGVATILQDITGYTEDLSFMQERAGLTQEAFAKQTNTLGFHFSVLKETLNEIWRIIGENLLPIVMPMIDKFKELLDWITLLPESTKQFVIQLTMLIGILGTVTGAIMLFVGALLAIPGANVVVIIGLIIGALAGLGVAWKNNFMGFKAWGDAIWTTLKSVVNMVVDGLSFLGATIAETTTRIWEIIKRPWRIGAEVKAYFSDMGMLWNELSSRTEQNMVNMENAWINAVTGAHRVTSETSQKNKAEMDSWEVKHATVSQKIMQHNATAMEKMKSKGTETFGHLNVVSEEFKRKQQQTVQTLSGGFSTFFRGILMSGKSVFESLTDVVNYAVGLIIQSLAKAIAKAMILKQAVGGGGIGRALGILAPFGMVGLMGAVISGAFTKMQGGGVVTEPTLAMLGEAGPEAVIPLNRSMQFGDVNVNISTPSVDLSNAEEISKAIAESVKQQLPESVRLSKIIQKTGSELGGESV